MSLGKELYYTKGHRVHKIGSSAIFEYEFLTIIDLFGTPRWKENHSESSKKLKRKSTNGSRTWTKFSLFYNFHFFIT